MGAQAAVPGGVPGAVPGAASLGMIWAEARGGAIGRAGDMPWHLPEDLAHFKRSTLGDPVVMGRRTWESLPERFRPLPGRANIVVSRDPAFTADGATVASSLEAALAELGVGRGAGLGVERGSELGVERGAETGVERGSEPAAGRAWIMGGGQLYRAAMPLADTLLVTRIELDVPDADTFAPEIGPEWRLADEGEPLVAASGLGYRFERYERAS